MIPLLVFVCTQFVIKAANICCICTCTNETDIALKQDGRLKSIRQPDGSLRYPEADYPFLVLEIAHSETDKNALKKAKDYIRYSRGKIIYVIVVSVRSNEHNQISKEEGSIEVKAKSSSINPVEQSLSEGHV